MDLSGRHTYSGDLLLLFDDPFVFQWLFWPLSLFRRTIVPGESFCLSPFFRWTFILATHFLAIFFLLLWWFSPFLSHFPVTDATPMTFLGKFLWSPTGVAHGIENGASMYPHSHHLCQLNSFVRRSMMAHLAPFPVAISCYCIVYLMRLCPWSFNSIGLILGKNPALHCMFLFCAFLGTIWFAPCSYCFYSSCICWFLWGCKPILPSTCCSFSGEELLPPILLPSFSACFWPPPSACHLFSGKELFGCLFYRCPFLAYFSMTSLASLSLYDDFVSSIWIIGSPYFV